MNGDHTPQHDGLDCSKCQCGPGHYCNWCITNADKLLPLPEESESA